MQHLIFSRRFMPLFLTQFLGAFNDNVYKNALVIMILFQGDMLYGLDSNIIVTLSAGIFILPYFLVSATAGQLSDKYEKSMLIQRVKLLEIGLMLLAIVGFLTQNFALLIALLFMMGLQSTLFGPLKYAIIPQLLREEELMGANGIISMGVFLAILLGMILGGVLIAIKPNGVWIVSGAVVLFAILGWLSSRWIPTAPASEPDIRISANIPVQTWKTMQYALEKRSVFVAAVAMSWFWFVGATYLSQVPDFAKSVLGGNESVVTLLLTMFSIGIGFGSVLCEKLSRGRIELGLVPLGALGITVFSVDVYFATKPFLQEVTPVVAINAWELLAMWSSWRIMVDLVLVGMFGGFYIVPLYAMIQQRSNPLHRARVIAANNIFNACFMVSSALITVWLLSNKFSIPEIFLVLAIGNALLTSLFFWILPEFVTRFLSWVGLWRES